MSFRPCRRLAGRWAVILGMVGVLALAPGMTVRAAEPAAGPGAIAEMPADAAFFASMLRNREQIEAIAKSKAWAKLTALPVVKLAWETAKENFNQHVANDEKAKAFMDFWDEADNKQLLATLLDMVGDEIYIAGGPGWTDSAQLLIQINSVAQMNSFAELGKGDPEEQKQKLGKAILKALAANPKALKAPDLLIGFKLRDTARAKTQLGRLETLLEAAALIEDFPGKYKKTKVGGSEFLTLAFDASKLPLDQFPVKDFEEKPGEFDDLMKKIKNLKATIGVGIRGDYLLLSIGESTDFIAGLGKGRKLLDRVELQPLVKAGSQRLTSVAYVSKDFASRLGGPKQAFDSYAQMTDGFLQAAPLDDDLKKRIKKDVTGLMTEMKGLIPEPGAVLGYSFMTERGYEAFLHSYTADKLPNTSEPLALLNHVGGEPLVAVVGRSKTTPEGYARFVHWAGVAWNYYEEFGLPQIHDDDARKKAETFIKELKPLAAKFNAVTEKMLIPALADGQSAFVLDSKLTSKRWFNRMPQSETALPMFEPALVYGVSDAQLLEKAFGEYRSLANKTYAAARKVNPDAPEFEIPAPEAKQLKGGTGYFYRLPTEWGLDERIAPNAGVSPKVAVLSISEEHTERLLKATPLKLNGGPLADLKKPMTAASYVRYSGFVDVLDMWGEYGFKVAGPLAVLLGGVPQEQVNEAQKTTKTIFEVLKVFDSTSSATYIEGGAVITHSETLIIDK